MYLKGDLLARLVVHSVHSMYILINTHVCMYICIYVHTHTLTHIYKYLQMCICMYLKGAYLALVVILLRHSIYIHM